jgi:hypothetical protein
MGMKKSVRHARTRQAKGLCNISTLSGGARSSRASLLAGASLVALGAFAAPDRALAQCSGLGQTISTATPGPVFSDGGAITVSDTGSITGGLGGDGVDAVTCPITTLTNQSGGTISGGKGGNGGSTGAGMGGVGGAGVSNASTITALSNSGAISGGNGGSGGGDGGVGGVGGAGVSNASTINTLSNRGAISGGNGGKPIFLATGGAGGVGVSNAGTITTLINRGAIGGGSGGVFSGTGGAGGAGVSNSQGATITRLSNSGTISGGKGGNGGLGFSEAGGGGGAGGAGVSNAHTIATLTNSGTISGGNGGNGISSFAAGVGGVGVSNAGTITRLSNSGTISGGAGGAGATPGAAGDAIYSAGAGASIGPITNSGSIIGNVEIDNQASVTVTGGTGKTFGHFTGGTITIGAGNLTFAGGNTALGDDVEVDGGKGTVINKGKLQITTLAPLAITGNFTQTAAGVLGLDFAGDGLGQYGALTATKVTTLDGRLNIDLTNGFTLAKGDSFDILAFRSLMGGFDALSLDRAACSMAGADSWSCGGGVRLKEDIFATSLDLVVTHAPAVFGPAGSSAIPEPSTWAMLGLGLLGLGGLGLRKRKRAGEIGLG